MSDDLTISTTILSENWEITVTQHEDSVDLDIVNQTVDMSIGAVLSPEFAKELGSALQEAGYAASPDDEDD